MPLDAARNSLVLPILGLLVEEPAHAYEVTARLEARYPHLKIRRSSVVTLLKSLSEGGLLTAAAPERVANRPARTIYRPTDAGIDLFRARVREGLTEAAPASADFLTAVAYLGILPAVEAIAVLRARAERLRRETPVIPPGLPEIQMIEVHYWLRVLDTEISWLSETADRLAGGDLEVLV
ncbi:helix-turn-helix transcriptional regulator [Actinoplanes sp. LDG1-06]|uniref:Helix-turn-helix transcriptional regulator n=1 Tax=Paractinoplanes ovalisporus TaxID=2810368 RepID=A0ABS2AVK7_9ACTN|nr:helix-turn-helix transcriptional regulator [Actinoplanes ovalisporus]MBM2623831.1 helix-turn-helix transcriptional regulator [Actinoplanes ovalisporus]